DWSSDVYSSDLGPPGGPGPGDRGGGGRVHGTHLGPPGRGAAVATVAAPFGVRARGGAGGAGGGGRAGDLAAGDALPEGRERARARGGGARHRGGRRGRLDHGPGAAAG